MNFIPFVTPHNNPRLNIIIGANGSGKSSILEALDLYFNRNSDFIISSNEKRTEAFVSPIFLLDKSINDLIWEKNYYSSLKKIEIEQITQEISDFLWNFIAPPSATAQVEFQKLIDNLKTDHIKESGGILLVDGINSDFDITLGRFDDLLRILNE